MSWICGRSCRRARSSTLTMSFPSNQILPDVGDSRQAMHDASVLLPDPDSPTTTSVVPGKTVKDTPFNASNSSRMPTILEYRRHGLEQSLGVGMPGRREHGCSRSTFDNLAAVKD